MGAPYYVTHGYWDTSAGTTVNVKATTPTGVRAGDLLLVFFARASQAGTGTIDGKWTALTTNSITAALGSGVVYAIADGTETGDLALTTLGGADRAGSITLLIRGHRNHGTFIDAPANDTWQETSASASSNPNALTPSWAYSAETLWLAWTVQDVGSRSTTTDPTGYGTKISDDGAGLGALSFNLLMRTATASTENPSAFTWSGTGNNTACTVAVLGERNRHGFINHNNPGIQ